MLNKNDYWPFYFGVLVFGGLLVIPAIFQFMISTGWFPRKDSYGMSIALSLMYSACFVMALKRENCKIDFGKLVGYFVLVNLLLLLKLFKDGVFLLIGPGVIVLLVLYASGWAGVIIGRVFGVGELIESYNDKPHSILKKISNAIADSRARARARQKELKTKYSKSVAFEIDRAKDNGACPYCGGGLRTATAKQCPHCFKSWHDDPSMAELDSKKP